MPLFLVTRPKGAGHLRNTLKHPAVTWAFMKGMTLKTAVDFFATSRETLENTYRSYHPDAQREAVEIMDRDVL